MSDLWTEVKYNSEGVSITLYENYGGEPLVVDERWHTWDEIEELKEEEHTEILE